MLVARLICSDTDCADEVLARAPSEGELEALACDCGCALEIIGWPDVEETLELVAHGHGPIPLIRRYELVRAA